MRKDAVAIEDSRLKDLDLDTYPWIHERHRIFPGVFGEEKYGKILDIAAGAGLVAKRIQDRYPCFMLCNDISPESIRFLRANMLRTVSFDLDDPNSYFPFPDETFDAVISLATLEHIINIDHHMQ
jgi:SAM-dependent methyltransferase